MAGAPAQSADRRELPDCPQHRPGVSGARRFGGPFLAPVAGAGRCGARSAAVPVATAGCFGDTIPSRHGAAPQGAEPQGRDPEAFVAGVQGGPSRGLPVQPVLPAVSSVGGPSGCLPSPELPGRGEAPRGLRGPDDDDRRPGNGTGKPRPSSSWPSWGPATTPSAGPR